MLKVDKINKLKSVLPVLVLLVSATVCFGLGRISDGTFVIRRAVLDNAGGAISEAPLGGLFAMNNSVGQPSAIGISTVAAYPGKLYAGYQLPLILSEVDSLVIQLVYTTTNMQLWWEKIPWATGYYIYTNSTDPFGLYTRIRATWRTSYTDAGAATIVPKQFYRVTALRPWVTP